MEFEFIIGALVTLLYLWLQVALVLAVRRMASAVEKIAKSTTKP